MSIGIQSIFREFRGYFLHRLSVPSGSLCKYFFYYFKLLKCYNFPISFLFSISRNKFRTATGLYC